MGWLEERRRRTRADHLARRVSVLDSQARKDLFTQAVREGVLTQAQADSLESAAARGQVNDRLVDAAQVRVPVISRDDALRQAASVDRSLLPMSITFVLALASLYLALRPLDHDLFWQHLVLPLLFAMPIVLIVYTTLRWRERAAVNARAISLGVSVEDFGLGGRIRRRTAHPGNLLLFQFTVLGLGTVSIIDIILIAGGMGIWLGGLLGTLLTIAIFIGGLILIMMTWLTFATIHFTRVVLDDIEADTNKGASSGDGGKLTTRSR